VLLNILFNEIKAGNRPTPSVVSAAPPVLVHPAEDSEHPADTARTSAVRNE